MNQPAFDDFGQLYRAAFAECDPEKKSRLLSAVQEALAEWAKKTEGMQSAGVWMQSGSA